MSPEDTSSLTDRTVWQLSYYKLNDPANDTRTMPDNPDFFDADDTTEFFIGIFSSAERAQAVVDQLSDQPGFRDDLEGFRFDSVVIDQVGWQEGFVSD